MELSPRKRAVLTAIVKSYIQTGEPVGSKILTGLIANAPSSATLRNEMSELCDLGLLNQPHTSAGRIPTNNGLRLYVNSLMSLEKITDSTKEYIDDSFSAIHCDIENIPSIAGQILSKLAGLPSVTTFVASEDTKLKRVELLPISRNSAMLLIITSDGRTRNRVFRFGLGFTNELQKQFIEIVNTKINKKRLNELNLAYMQSVIASCGIDSLKLLPLLTAVFEMVSEIDQKKVDLKGAPFLFNICSDDNAKKLISLTESEEPFIMFFENAKDNVNVIFGNDIKLRELKQNTVIAAKYSGADKYKGTISIIGPNRMSYEQIIPAIEYTAQKLTKIMTEAQKDMED